MFIKSKFTHVAYTRLDSDNSASCFVCVAELIGHLNSGKLLVADKGQFRISFQLDRTTSKDNLVRIDGPVHGNRGKVLVPSFVECDEVLYIEGAEAAIAWLEEEYTSALKMRSVENDPAMAAASCAYYRDQFFAQVARNNKTLQG